MPGNALLRRQQRRGHRRLVGVHRRHRRRVVPEQVAAGRSRRRRSTPTWRRSTTWDRYDFDDDGNFDESDGYIDHFQAVHAGEGEEAGGGAQGEDAIWSHRWYVNGDDFGPTGPTVGDQQNKSGGAQIGDSNYWIGDYTIEPENGGLGVFAHEFGHDLGLPDYYDTAGGENGTAFWTLMSSGSWLGHGAAADEGIGTTPGLMGPEEKLELGWLDYTEVDAGQTRRRSRSSPRPGQPTRAPTRRSRSTCPTRPPSRTTRPRLGQHAWWTGRGDDLNDTLTRSVPQLAQVTVTAKAWYEIEAGYDYLYAEYSTERRRLDPGRQADRRHVATASGRRCATPTPPAGRDAVPVPLPDRRRRATRPARSSTTSASRPAPRRSPTTSSRATGGWTADGRGRSRPAPRPGPRRRYYLLENRQYVGYDDTLGTGPYQFSCGLHAARLGRVLLVPARHAGVATSTTPTRTTTPPSTRASARRCRWTPARRRSPTPTAPGPSNRRQPFDATFGLEPTPEMCLHKEVARRQGRQTQTVETVAACAPASAGIATFDDSDPLALLDATRTRRTSVKVAGAGVTADGRRPGRRLPPGRGDQPRRVTAG